MLNAARRARVAIVLTQAVAFGACGAQEQASLRPVTDTASSRAVGTWRYDAASTVDGLVDSLEGKLSTDTHDRLRTKVEPARGLFAEVAFHPTGTVLLTTNRGAKTARWEEWGGFITIYENGIKEEGVVFQLQGDDLVMRLLAGNLVMHRIAVPSSPPGPTERTGM
jgi:hypothetical protein